MKRLPKIEDKQLCMAIDRLQSNTDFIRLRKFLQGDGTMHIVDGIKDRTDTQELHWDQGALHILDDLEEMCGGAGQWARDMHDLDLSVGKPKTKWA